MAEYTQDRSDGEHLLPSDMFISSPQSKHSLNLNAHFSSCMDDLAQQLSALTLLKQKHYKTLSKPKPNPYSKTTHNLQFLPVEENPPCQGCLGINKNNFNFIPKRDYFNNSELYYEYNMRKPVQPNKVDVFLETRARALQRQQYLQQQIEQIKLNQNRVIQNQNRFSVGGNVGGFGFVKVSGGTGVFHPRVLNLNSTSNNVANISTTTTNTPLFKKKQVMRQHNRSEIQVPQRNCISTTTTTSSLAHYKIPSEMGLPKDWTY